MPCLYVITIMWILIRLATRPFVFLWRLTGVVMSVITSFVVNQRVERSIESIKVSMQLAMTL